MHLWITQFFFFISFKCFLTWDCCKKNAGKVHPTVKLLSLPFFILLVRHCSASLHMLRQNHSTFELAGNINSNCITDTCSFLLLQQKSHSKPLRPVWNVNTSTRGSIYIFDALVYSGLFICLLAFLCQLLNVNVKGFAGGSSSLSLRFFLMHDFFDCFNFQSQWTLHFGSYGCMIVAAG